MQDGRKDGGTMLASQSLSLVRIVNFNPLTMSMHSNVWEAMKPITKGLSAFHE